MANIVITSTTNCIKVDFGDYATTFNKKKWSIHKSDLHLTLMPSDAYVEFQYEDQAPIHISHTAGDGLFIVDSVAGNPPSSVSDLYDKLDLLLG